ncbi:MAG: glutamine-hydrolyzing carbamoyl-phosphate synthase small subunit [Myxococcales bacterium]|nr:glutamine-hydrolyzing carbamoyl-phosphate synthase small subunit [Myxococcales bacterium]
MTSSAGNTRRKAHLALADGTVFEGFAWGADGATTGEVVFTTGMTGYQEILTDPSYSGQLVTMTAPQIGNTGVNKDDPESVDGKPQVSGFIVRDPSPNTSNYRAEQPLEDYLQQHGIVGIGGVDTRRLTRLLRDKGAQNGAIGTEDPDTLVDRAKAAPSMAGLDLVSRVTPKERYDFNQGRTQWAVPFQFADLYRPDQVKPRDAEFHVVAYDYGAKKNILRCLVDSGCRVTAVPASTSAADVLALNPDGIFLSNGPGDPAAVDYAVGSIKQLLGKKPIFGICLGHQLLALALGAKTYKLKFGHRGLNQPVKDLATSRVEITSQNHGFVVDVDSIGDLAKTTHLHLNDGTSEGLAAPDAKAFSVQYHPESAAGPHDSLYLFDRFIESMRSA